MSCPFDDVQLEKLKVFVNLCKNQPQLLQHPKLSFFKDYLISLGVVLPTATFETNFEANFGATFGCAAAGDKESGNNNADEEVSSDSESDVELDMEGVIEADVIDNSQEMGGDPEREIPEEERDQSDEKRSQAMKAFSDQQYDEAIKLFTEAIILNPQSALLFAKRGQAYLKLNKPNACIKDCAHALELNCDSAAAYKFRGRAYRLLGKFEEASHDLCESLKIDYDDQTNEWLNEVKPNAEKLRQHKLSVQRKHEEKLHHEKITRARQQQEARAAHARAEQTGFGHQGAGGRTFTTFGSQGAGAFTDGGPFTFTPRPGPVPPAKPSAEDAKKAGVNQTDFMNLIGDPEVIAAFEDPDVAAAFNDISSNPANFMKYQSNPKVLSVIEKLQSKFSKAGFSYGGAGAGGPDTPPQPKPPAGDDVGLD